MIDYRVPLTVVEQKRPAWAPDDADTNDPDPLRAARIMIQSVFASALVYGFLILVLLWAKA